MKRILVFPGGGVMGMYQALVLSGVGNLHKVDAVAGTSIGSVFAAALAHGKLDGFYEMFKGAAPRIFAGYWWRHLMKYPPPRYGDDELNAVLQEYFKGGHLRDMLLPCFIVSGKLRTGSPKVFFSRSAEDMDLPTWRVVRCSVSAPTYFEQFDLRDDGERYTDGGMYANNPAMCAIAGAQDALNWDTEDVSVYKVGTGIRAKPRATGPDSDLTSYMGALGFVASALFDGASDCMHDFMAEAMLPDGRYLVADFDLPGGWNMDDPKTVDKIVSNFSDRAALHARDIEKWLDC